MGRIDKKYRENSGVSRDQLLTVDDLFNFRTTLIKDIKEIMVEVVNNNNGQQVKNWLKSEEVRDLLSLSTGKLYSLRKRGILPYTRIGGMIYYSYQDIQKMLDSGKLLDQ
ncbi:helix-turn-helix domain-containing protein [Mucilaginibacter paludis]|uniref:Helix-turn-helix domain-containing protein n=1 Tax=Mucilaginibacter paludis DSM 18603 TaxID=714943 RepID=H1YDY2_9SPHI|nr:helix-turn-helix domain-containing protein [Mucilaginibacter paludis]EHQ24322.1 hypothetical protein Mucpa_0119 [Mucilaginibacter paludis DSM 18603]